MLCPSLVPDPHPPSQVEQDWHRGGGLDNTLWIIIYNVPARQLSQSLQRWRASCTQQRQRSSLSFAPRSLVLFTVRTRCSPRMFPTPSLPKSHLWRPPWEGGPSGLRSADRPSLFIRPCFIFDLLCSPHTLIYRRSPLPAKLPPSEGILTGYAKGVTGHSTLSMATSLIFSSILYWPTSGYV